MTILRASSLPGGNSTVGSSVVSEDIREVITLTQAEYDALTPDPEILYLISDEAPGPPVEARIATSETTTSTSWADLATVGPSVDAVIGASGKCLVLWTSYMRTADLNDRVDSGVQVDGVDPPNQEYAILQRNTDRVSVHGSVLVNGLSPGLHTFKLRYRTATGATGTISERGIIAIPLDR